VGLIASVHGAQIDAGPGPKLSLSWSLSRWPKFWQAGGVGVFGLMRPTGAANVLDKLANAFARRD
jgi:hypothetical protein